jgi:hypothetical protein
MPIPPASESPAIRLLQLIYADRRCLEAELTVELQQHAPSHRICVDRRYWEAELLKKAPAKPQ